MLYNEAKKQTILGVTYKALETIPAEQMTAPDIAAKWKNKKEKIAIMGEVYEDHNRRTNKLLAERGFRCCILKGQGLATRFYPEPSLRQSGDIDVWVEGNRREIVRKLLKGFPVRHIYYHECKVGFFPHLTTEVHFLPVRMYNPFNSCKLQKYFESCKEESMRAKVPGREYCAPEAPFNAVYLMGHILRHALNGGVGLRHIWDYYYVLKALTPAQKKEACKELTRLGMKGISQEVMYVLGYLFALPKDEMLISPNERRGKKLLADILREGNFGMGLDAKERKKRRNKKIHFLRRFPSEVLWALPSRLWHHCWRRAFKLTL